MVAGLWGVRAAPEEGLAHNGWPPQDLLINFRFGGAVNAGGCLR